MADCLFCKIVAGEIPSREVMSTEDTYSFFDINPAAPVHFLV
ncbi:MAG: HIT domain-containing protein, partial [Acidimicrobiales bacterium]